MAQQIGYLVSSIILPLILLGIIWCIQLMRTRDKAAARAAVFSRWPIIFAVGLWLLVMLSRLSRIAQYS